MTSSSDQYKRALRDGTPPSAHPALQLASDYVVTCTLMLQYRPGSRDHAVTLDKAGQQWEALAAALLGGLAWPSMRERLDTLRALIANDAYAASFQTTAQYRAALLQVMDGGPAT